MSDPTVVVETHVVKTKINVSKEPGEEDRQKRRRHVEIDDPARPATRMVEHRGHPDETDYRQRNDDDQCEDVVRLTLARQLGRVSGEARLIRAPVSTK